MKDFIPIITATIALFGTMLGIYFGYRKWHLDRKATRFNQFEKDLQRVYRELWEKVETFNIRVRVEEINMEQFSEHLKDLNSFMLQYGIYFEDEDRDLANKYANAVFNFQNAVRNSDIEEARIPLGETQVIPQEVIDQAKEIGEAQELALQIRSQIRTRIRTVLSGDS
jgi:hypothetical protein